MKITNVRERYEHALEVITPGTVSLNGDSSLVIRAVAVPPSEAIGHDLLIVSVGERIVFSCPLKYVMDHYDPDISLAMQHLLQIHQQVLVILDAVLDKDKARTDSTALALASASSDIFKCTEVIRNAKMSIGMELVQAILVPPRLPLSVKCTLGSKVPVYLVGTRSDPVQ